MYTYLKWELFFVTNNNFKLIFIGYYVEKIGP